MVVLLVRSCLARAVPGMRCPHHWQKLYSSLEETMNTRRRLGVIPGADAAVWLFPSCLLAPVSWAFFSSSISAWIAHCPNVRSLPGATCRCRSNRYNRSVEVRRAGRVASLPSSVSVSRAVCLYRRVIYCFSSSHRCRRRRAAAPSVPACPVVVVACVVPLRLYHPAGTCSVLVRR